MDLVQDKLTIVLAGAFNPAILTPQWIARNALGYPEERQFQVEMLTPVAGIGGMPRYSFDGISYAPNFQSVTFFLANLDEQGRQRVATTMARILELLPHTPVAGLGFNFGFYVREPHAALQTHLSSSLELTGALGEGAAVANRQWSNAVNWHGAIVTVQAQQTARPVAIDMNFHYGVADAGAARGILSRPNGYRDHLAAAVRGAEALSHEGVV